ncbi:hypothetical protein [Acidocella sp.]|uniref:hypothetical protein n=1 Tax=Acidocella sp. TaxID=50710 RepID=UPI00180BAA7A|nr:hypothetical protein [Acidocella sp.]NNM57009.1 hypothetical protein [Acidocella sp.]
MYTKADGPRFCAIIEMTEAGRQVICMIRPAADRGFIAAPEIVHESPPGLASDAAARSIAEHLARAKGYEPEEIEWE